MPDEVMEILSEANFGEAHRTCIRCELLKPLSNFNKPKSYICNGCLSRKTKYKAIPNAEKTYPKIEDEIIRQRINEPAKGRLQH